MSSSGVRIQAPTFNNLTEYEILADPTATSITVIGECDARIHTLEITLDQGTTWKPLSSVAQSGDVECGSDQRFELTLSYTTLGLSPDVALVRTVRVRGMTQIGETETSLLHVRMEPIVRKVGFALSQVSFDEGDGTQSLTVQMNQASETPVTVDVAILSSDLSGGDYTLSTLGTLTFGTILSQSLTFSIVDDALNENDESLVLGLSNAVGAVLDSSFETLTVTVRDNDPNPSLFFASSAQSGNESSLGSVPVEVLLSPVSGRDVVFSLQALGAVGDYTLSASTLTVPAGSTVGTVTVHVLDDTDPEPDESLILNLVSIVNADAAAPSSFTLTILDDDTLPAVTIDDVLVSEEAGSAVFTVNVDSVSATDIQIAWATEDDTAAAGADYTASSGTLTIAAGATVGYITVVLLGDSLDEDSPEQFKLNLTGVSTANAVLADAMAFGQLIDDDSTPTVFWAASAQSRDEGVGSVDLVIELSAVSGRDIQVSHAVSGTATGSGTDHTLTPGTTTVPAGSLLATISFNLVDDTRNEDSETVIATLSAPTNASLGAPVSHTVTITDNDPLPVLSIDGVAVVETIGTAVFTVTLSAESGRTVSFDWATSDGTALSGSDYTASGQSGLLMPAGQTKSLLTVAILHDGLDEDDETFTITLSGGANYDVAGSNLVATGSIQDSDPEPNVAFVSSSQTVGEGVGVVSLDIQLSTESGRSVTVPYTVSGTAVGGGSDHNLTDGNIIIVAGQTSQSLSFTITDDGAIEAAETVIITMGTALGATVVSPSVHTVTINDNDGSPTLDIQPVTVGEAVGDAVFTVNLSVASGLDVVFDWATSNGSATAGADYTSSSGSATIQSGDTFATLTVPILNDALDELNETFTVTLSNASNATISTGTVSGTITDDDDAPIIQFAAASQSIGEDHGTVTVIAELSAESGLTVTVPYTVSGTASGGGVDHNLVGDNIVITAGTTVASVTFAVEDDGLYEFAETVILTMGTAANATASDTTVHTVTINDNDTAPGLSLSDSTASESAGSMVFTVTLNAASGRVTTFDWSTADGTAVSTSDYTAVTTTTETIAAGDTVATLTVTLANDAMNEPTETFTVTLGSGANATIADGTAVGTIVDDDSVPSVQFAAASQAVDEGDGTITVTAHLSAESGQMVTVPFTVSGTSENGGVDHNLADGHIVISVGSTVGLATFTVNDDTLDEDNETVILTMGAAANADLGATTVHTVTINDNDDLPALSIADVSVGEEAGPAVFTVSLDAISGRAVTFSWVTGHGTAGALDYTVVSTTDVTIPAGQSTANLTVAISNDSLDEDDETFTVSLSGAGYATIADDTGIGTIVDDDALPEVQFASTSQSVSEANGFATVLVSLIPVSGRSVTASYTVSGTAIGGGTDYSLIDGTVTIAEGATAVEIIFPIIDDGLSETDESVVLTIASQTNADLGSPASHTVTITDNDGVPTLSVGDVSLNENEGPAVFTVSLSATSGQNVTFNWQTNHGTAGASDYTAVAATTVTIAAGDSAATLTVAITDDTLDESDETFTVTLSGGANYDVGGSTLVATGTIVDDDAAPSVYFVGSSQAVDEDQGTVTVTAHLSAESGLTVAVPYTVTGTASNGGVDHNLADGNIVVTAGSTVASVTFTVEDDALYEFAETVILTMGTATNATASGTTVHTVTINDNDTAPGLSLSDSSAAENTGSMVFTVTLDVESGRDTIFDWSTTDGTATTSDDYTSVATTTVTIAAGDLMATLHVALTDDLLYEATETFTVNLSGAVNATISDNTGIGTITDDDAVPTVQFASASQAVDEADGTVTVTAELSAQSGLTVTVPYTVSGTASGGGVDHNLADGEIVISAGSLVGSVTFAITDDGLTETAETVVLTMGAASDATISGTTVHTVTINDDDPAPILSLSDTSAPESSGLLVFTVTLSAQSVWPVTFNWATSDGTATSPGDYTAVASTTETIAVGQTLATLTITLADNSAALIDESNETLTVTLSNPVNAVIPDPSATGTIVEKTLDLNFLTGTLPSDVTLTRSTAGTYIDAGGVLQTAAANEPRFEYDFDTGEPLGLLSESRSTNLALYSQTLNNAAWSQSGAGSITCGQSSPDGGTNACLLNDTDGGAATYWRQSGININTTPYIYTVSAFVKAGSSDLVTLRLETVTSTTIVNTLQFRFSNQEIVTSAGALDARFLRLANGWYRIWMTVWSSANNNEARISLYPGPVSPVGHTGSAAYFGIQYEREYRPTSYIATTASAVLRATDVIQVENVDSWYNATEGTFIAEVVRSVYESNDAIAFPRILTACTLGTCGSDRFVINYSAGATRWGIHSKLGASSASSIGWIERGVPNHIYQVAMVIKSGSIQGAVNGFLGVDSGPISMPTVNTLWLGSEPELDGDALGGHFRRLSYRQRALNAEQLAAMTTTTACPQYYTSVPGLAGYSDRFCVMKYEAKDNGSSQAVSQAASAPWATISQSSALAKCQELGTGYDLISNSEWMAIARNIENVSWNWGGHTIGSTAGLNRGLSDSSPNSPQAAGADTAPCYGTGDSCSLTTWHSQRRMNRLSNHQYVWDLAGNVTEMLRDEVAESAQSDIYISQLTDATLKAKYGPAGNYTALSSTPYGGLGQLTMAVPGTVMSRGGGYSTGVASGVFNANLSHNSSSTFDGRGFRCSYRPSLGAGNGGDAPTVGEQGVLSIDDVIVSEAGTAVFTVTLLEAIDQDVIFNWSTSNGTAIAGEDYTASSGTVTIATGDVQALLTVPLINDLLDEVDEEFTVSLSNSVNAVFSDHTAIGQIVDDDSPPTLSVAAVTVNEQDGSAVFTVTLSALSGQSVIFNWATSDGTASAGDYTAVVSTTVTIAAGDGSATLTVAITDDTLDENNETLTVTLSGGVNYETSGSTLVATGTIVDNDDPPTVQFTSTSQSVNEDQGTVTVTTALSTLSGLSVTVPYTVSGSATAGGVDHNLSSGNIVIPAGSTTGSTTFAVTNDVLYESAETVILTMGSPVNAVLGANTVHTVTIQDNDNEPALLILADVTGNEDAGPLVFVAILDAESGMDVTFDWQTLDGTAVSPVDYTSVGVTTETIAAGQTSVSLTVHLISDLFYEADETFTIQLSNSVNAALADSSAIGTIVNDDSPPVVQFALVSQTVGENVGAVTVTASLSPESGLSVTIPYTVTGTAQGSGVDHNLAAGQIVMNAHSTSASVSFTVVNDGLDEDDETVILTMSSAAQASLGTVTVHTVTIQDDDDVPELSLANSSAAEADGSMVFTVTLSPISGRPVVFEWETADGTAEAPGDYTAISLTSVTIGAGESVTHLTVPLIADLRDEEDEETFTVVLSSIQNASNIQNVAEGRILDSDDMPTVQFVSAGSTVTEGVSATVLVSLSSVSDRGVSVSYTLGGTATEVADYSVSGSPVSIPSGELNATIVISTALDVLTEGDETLTLELLSPGTNATLGATTLYTLTIQDPGASTLAVVAEYPGFEDWNEYRKSSTNSVCDPLDVAATGYAHCIHGGERRKIELPGSYTVCTNLEIRDNLSAFNWRCVEGSSPLEFRMAGFAPGKGLKDLINVSGTGWKSMQVALWDNGVDTGEQSALEPWWSNTVTPLPDSASSVQTLSGSGTIYTLPASASSLGYLINTDQVGVVTLGNAVLYAATAGTSGDTCGTTPSARCILDIRGTSGSAPVSFLWIEGNFRGDEFDNNMRNVVRMEWTHFSRLHQVRAQGGYQDSTLGKAEAVVSLISSQLNKVEDLFALGNAYYKTNGLNLISSHRNTFQKVRAALGRTGIWVTGDSSENRLSQVIANNNTMGGLLVENAKKNTFFGLTLMNNVGAAGLKIGAPGIYSDAAYNQFINIAVGNNAAGVNIGKVWHTRFEKMLISNNGGYGISSSGANSTAIQSFMRFGPHTTGYCLVDVGMDTDAGFKNTCASAGISSYVYDTTRSLTDSILALVTSDSASDVDTDGTLLWDAAREGKFMTAVENIFRTWGAYNVNVFPNTQHRGHPSLYAGIWDWRVKSIGQLFNRSGDGLNANGIFPTNSTNACPSQVAGNAVSQDPSTGTNFLSNAIEILGDGIGNDDGRCESNEECLYAPNIGAYQGEGPGLRSCAFSNGTVTGVKIKAWTNFSPP